MIFISTRCHFVQKCVTVTNTQDLLKNRYSLVFKSSQTWKIYSNLMSLQNKNQKALINMRPETPSASPTFERWFWKETCDEYYIWKTRISKNARFRDQGITCGVHPLYLKNPLLSRGRRSSISSSSSACVTKHLKLWKANLN